MAEVGKARKAQDRRRVRAVRVVDTAHVGRAAGNTIKPGRTQEFRAGTGKNGRA